MGEMVFMPKLNCVSTKKDNEYTFNHFYQYLFDFTTYQDDLNYVTMNGIEDSFYSKFQTFANTEYAVPLPQLSNKLFINFTGTSVVRENRLQFSYGEPIKGWLTPNNFPLRGTRAVRSFVRELAFTDSEGLPYESLTIRAVENVTFDLKVNIGHTNKRMDYNITWKSWTHALGYGNINRMEI